MLGDCGPSAHVNPLLFLPEDREVHRRVNRVHLFILVFISLDYTIVIIYYKLC